MGCIVIQNAQRDDLYPLTVLSERVTGRIVGKCTLKISIFFLLKVGRVVNCSQDEFILARALYIHV